MLVYAGPDLRPVPADVLLRAVLRSDLTPVPQTAEIVVRDDPDFRAAWADGETIAVGREKARFVIVKSAVDATSGLIQGPRAFGTLRVTALLASCAPVAQPLTRAVIREGSTLGGIYRACGAPVRIEQDFTVPRFAAFAGDIPSFDIAIALQEEGAALTFRRGRLVFRRLADLAGDNPVAELPEATDVAEVAGYKERLVVPFAYSTAPDGSIVFGRRESGRRALFWPRTDARILRNLSAVLIQRRTVQAEFAPDIVAGDRVRIGAASPVVITAAHVFDHDGNQPTQSSKFWLGEYVT